MLRYSAGVTGLARRGLLPITPPAPPVGPVFTLFSMKPTPDIIGAGVIRAYPTKIITGNVTVDETTGPLLDTIVMGKTTFVGDPALGAYAENCDLMGAVAAPTGVSYLATTTGSTGTGYALRYCNLRPQTPSAWWNAVGTRNVRMYACNVWHCVDGARIYNAAGAVNSRISGCYFHDASHFSPDYGTGNRLRTHNDVGWQHDGNPGQPVTDCIMEGSWIDARHSTQIGDQPAPIAGNASEVSALMFTGDVAPECNALVDRTWIDGGDFAVNGGKNLTGKLTFTSDIFEKPGARNPGTRTAFVVDAGYTLVQSGLVYSDGTAVTRTLG